MSRAEIDVAIVGAGPAGLTAGYGLALGGKRVLIIERDPVYVGGIAKTVRYKGFLFDIGGHRFFSKSQRVEDFWTEMLGGDLIVRRRSSRIYYRNRFFSYPLRPWEALRKLGPVESLRCVLSYFGARVFPNRNPKSFEEWVCSQFGRRLFEIFFKTYTEKVWGMSCKEISADWAAQRIRGLSLAAAIRTAIVRRAPRSRSATIKTLIDSFRYPRRGPGMLWEEVARRFQDRGGRLVMGTEVASLRSEGKWRIELSTPSGSESVTAEHLVSSMAIRDLGLLLERQLPTDAFEATQQLHYRDFMIVVLILEGAELFPDHWIYVHDPDVRVGRIQNFKQWSSEMVPDPRFSSYGLEYFCFENDGLWTSTDDTLTALACSEMERLGFAMAGKVVDSCVVRQKKAYPVYDHAYLGHVETLKAAIAAKWPTLHLVGRNGMHKYNNQDHAMMTAFLAAENILAGRQLFDLWKVNVDAEYHEEARREEAGDEDIVPKRLRS